MRFILFCLIFVTSTSDFSDAKLEGCAMFAGVHVTYDAKRPINFDMNITIPEFKKFDLQNINDRQIFFDLDRGKDPKYQSFANATQIIVSWASRTPNRKTLSMKSIFIGEVCKDIERKGLFFVGVDGNGNVKTPLVLDTEYEDYVFQLKVD